MTQVLTEVTSQITDEFLRAVLRLDKVTDEACSVDWGRYALVCCHGVRVAPWYALREPEEHLLGRVAGLHEE